MNNTSGWIKLHRGLLDWEWYDDANCFRVFTHLLLTVNIKQKKWRGIVIKEGQIVTGRNKLSSDTGLTVQQVRTALIKLEKTKEVTTLKTSVGTVFTVVNWKKYQTSTTEQPRINHRTTTHQPQSNHASTTTKEDQEEEEYKEERERELSPFELIEKEKPTQLEAWKINNFKNVHEFDDLVKSFNNTAGIEILADNKPLEFNSAMLILRFQNFARSWISNQGAKMAVVKDLNSINASYKDLAIQQEEEYFAKYPEAK